jgi:hypothetical protein
VTALVVAAAKPAHASPEARKSARLCINRRCPFELRIAGGDTAEKASSQNVATSRPTLLDELRLGLIFNSFIAHAQSDRSFLLARRGR